MKIQNNFEKNKKVGDSKLQQFYWFCYKEPFDSVFVVLKDGLNDHFSFDVYSYGCF